MSDTDKLLDMDDICGKLTVGEALTSQETGLVIRLLEQVPEALEGEINRLKERVTFLEGRLQARRKTAKRKKR